MFDAANSEKDPAEEAQQAREILLRTLSRTPRSRYELKERLLKREISSEIADEVLDRYEEVGLIDDAEYARMLVRTCYREKGQARRAIAQELRRKGLSEAHSASALEQIDDSDESQRAQELVEKRVRSLGNVSRDRAVQRLMGYLGRRGYSTAVALSVIHSVLDSSDDGMI